MFCFYFNKTAAESCRLLKEAYGDHVPSQDTCEHGFGLKSGYFGVAVKEHGKPPKILRPGKTWRDSMY